MTPAEPTSAAPVAAPAPAGTGRALVIGDPVAHSLSPVLHRAGYEAAGLTGWGYEHHRVPEGTLAGFLDALPADVRGLSVTMPLKRELLALGRARGWDVSAHAAAAGGANTWVRADGAGTVALDNTDLPGAAAAVRERWGGPVGTVAVLGGGATAASVALALTDLGAASVRFLVRSPERAAETVAAVRAYAPAVDVEAVGLDAAAPADVLVSTIPAAAQDARQCARAEAPVVFEVVYDPWPTPLAAASEAAGSVLVTGLDLLVHQAVLQFEQFTGVPGPLAAMRAAGEAAVAARRAGRA
ncbi:shikimate dehydrogenase [Nocardioides sp. GY 10127]|uniref:shikimate dehydrogenase n=1 Tax=Nocardioides sp. GY 10127 TaxID=2569762 RepID=UPI0010A8CE53|nr:shikimate dehydrogenase [Nocardioides sp. GY 10127]TIC85489.1 shikimate dehydrogenase [Nocardioides sp. GY 10127]